MDICGLSVDMKVIDDFADKPASKKGKKVLVTLNADQAAMLESMTELGNSDAERLRNALIILNQTQALMEVMHSKLKD
jgi:hypothetical protein